jgi:Protein of unknown function (DUF4058)
MPLHDWKDDRGWDGVHLIWLAQLIDWVQPRLPAGYRAYVGSVPALTIDAPNGRPDVSVREWSASPVEPSTATAGAANAAPDQEAVATFTLDPQRAVHIDRHGQLIAAVEIVSPRNKDRPDSRERYLRRYAGYIRQGVHLLLIDVLPRPANFSFVDELGLDLGFAQEPCPVPCAASYRVGEPVPEGTIIALWRRPLAIGRPLPTIPLALDTRNQVDIDLEHTYREAAHRVYLD